jgi:ornithine carbamoyltransferase
MMEAPGSIVFDQAENRVWAQAAVVAFLLGVDRHVEA